MVDKVPYLDLAAQMKPIRAEIDKAIAENLDRCSFCLGPDVEQFEKDFATFCTTSHSIAFNSGTSALHVALRLLDIQPGDEIVTTPFTFVATSWAISYCHAKPVYVDIDPKTFNLDPKKLEAAITPRTKAIMPVHLYGHPFDVGPILEIGRKHKLPVIEDAAQAHGATYQGKTVGSFGVAAGFSFYPGKNLGAYGEAGALTTNDPAMAARAKSLREHGSKVRYYHDEIGYNYRMEGVQGAVLKVKLRYLREWTNARQRVARRYNSLLAGLPLELPSEAPGCESAWHLYVIRHPKREEIKKHLEAAGVGCALHYPMPLHLQKCYEFLGYKQGDFPESERAANQCLSLPIYPELTEKQQDRVVNVVKQYFNA